MRKFTTKELRNTAAVPAGGGPLRLAGRAGGFLARIRLTPPFFMGQTQTEGKMFLHTESSQHPCRVSTNKSREILLIVDDDPQIRRMLMRFFKHHFDSALTAATPADAERILRENVVTHILLDFHLGYNNPRGTELVVDWRRRYPLIRKALLLSGTRLQDKQIPPEVDHYFMKPIEPKDVMEALKS